jgi:hypothetical protein
MLAVEPTRIEFLWWRGCPSWERALEMLRAEMAMQGFGEEALEVIEIGDEAEAEAHGFPGSPTIRVEGEDVAPAEGDPIGLSCRVYPQRDGRISALPDPADLRDALERTRREQ